MKSAKRFFGMALVLASTLAAAAPRAVVTDFRPQENPIYCRTTQDFENRLSVIAGSSAESADHFSVKDLKLEVRGAGRDAILVVVARLRFYSCTDLGNGRFGWKPRAAGSDHYDFVALPRTQNFGGYLDAAAVPVGTDLRVRMERPLSDVLFFNEWKHFSHGATVRSVGLFLSFIPEGKNRMRQKARSPGYWLFFDLLAD